MPTFFYFTVYVTVLLALKPDFEAFNFMFRPFLSLFFIVTLNVPFFVAVVVYFFLPTVIFIFAFLLQVPFKIFVPFLYVVRTGASNVFAVVEVFDVLVDCGGESGVVEFGLVVGLGDAVAKLIKVPLIERLLIAVSPLLVTLVKSPPSIVVVEALFELYSSVGISKM